MRHQNTQQIPVWFPLWCVVADLNEILTLIFNPTLVLKGFNVVFVLSFI